MSRERETKKESEFSGEFLIGIILIAFCIFVIIESVQMPRRGPMGFLMSPGFVPALVGSVLLLLSTLFTINALRRGGYRRFGIWLSRTLSDLENKRFLVILALMGLYVVVLIGRVPFFLATLVFHFSIFTYLRAGSPLRITFYSLLISFFVAFLLPKLFEMPLP